ncbi:MAG: DUF4832 domain-containing protein [Phycisphaeraceae bacterium]
MHRITSLGLAVAVLLACTTPLASAQEMSIERVYMASDAELVNPERGFYRQWNSQDGVGALDLATMKQHRAAGMTLMLRLYYYKTFRDRPLTQDQLDLFDQDMNILREAGLKTILRFAYTEAIGDPDAPIDVVLGHMEQLRPLMHKHADVIAVAQGGFVGAWGEWHASMNDLAEPHNARRIIAKWLENLPEGRFVQIRTPRLKWMLLGHSRPIQSHHAWGTAAGRLAHHNDCFLSSPTDVGTYEDIELEKAYLAEETRYLPMGGETCQLTEFSAPDNARHELAMLHWSYLNLDYQPAVINMWRDEGFFNEVRDRLGYRLVLEKLSYPETASAGGAIDINLQLSNHGWAAPYNPRDLRMAIRHKTTGALYAVTLPDDPRLWLPGAPIAVTRTLGLPTDLVEGDYSLHLMLADGAASLRDRPEYAIQLANDGLYDANTGWHDLGITIKVEGESTAAILSDVRFLPAK